MLSDEHFMSEYKSGKEEAFNVLFERYSSMVYGYAKKRLTSSEVDDFYQSVWRHLHEKKELYQNQPFAPWFFVLIRNLLYDDYRSKSRRKKLIEESKNQLTETLLDLDMLEVALNTLPKQTAELIKKYYLEGFEYEDLAKETGLSQSNIRKRLSRAIQGLKDQFEV